MQKHETTLKETKRVRCCGVPSPWAIKPYEKHQVCTQNGGDYGFRGPLLTSHANTDENTHENTNEGVEIDHANVEINQ